jgi:hypothetical protein
MRRFFLMIRELAAPDWATPKNAMEPPSFYSFPFCRNPKLNLWLAKVAAACSLIPETLLRRHLERRQ